MRSRVTLPPPLGERRTKSIDDMTYVGLAWALLEALLSWSPYGLLLLEEQKESMLTFDLVFLVLKINHEMQFNNSD